MISQPKYDINDNRAVIHRLNRGDMTCFEACYKFYYRGLCSFASRWVPLSVAEDIVQDTMLYIRENRDKLLEELCALRRCALMGTVFRLLAHNGRYSRHVEEHLFHRFRTAEVGPFLRARALARR